MTIRTGKLTLRVGWRFIYRWPGIVRAARRTYAHGSVYIGPFVLERW